jgi:hypothetical protein
MLLAKVRGSGKGVTRAGGHIAKSRHLTQSSTMRVHPINDELHICYHLVNQSLPWLTEDGSEWLAAKHLENWNQAINFWQLRKQSPDLLAKIATPAGIVKGGSAINEIMILAAQLFLYANRNRQCRENMIDWGVGDDFPVLWKAGFNCCHAAMLRHNDIVRVAEFLALPLPDCGLLVCRCNVVMLQNKRYDRWRE